MDKMSISYITHPEEMSPDEFFDELDKLFDSDDGYIKHLERIKDQEEQLNYFFENLPEVLKRTVKWKEQNECLKADMVNLENENWKLKEEAECQAEVIRILKEEKETNMKTIQKLLADKQRESKEMLGRLERLNHFEDFVLEWERDGFETYLDEEGYKILWDSLEIVDKED